MVESMVPMMVESMVDSMVVLLVDMMGSSKVAWTAGPLVNLTVLLKVALLVVKMGEMMELQLVDWKAVETELSLAGPSAAWLV
jgi:hypothetical protein